MSISENGSSFDAPGVAMAGSTDKPVTLLPGKAILKPTSLHMLCHDRYFKSVTFLDADDTLVLSVEGKTWSSWTWRRTIRGGDGSHLFELRHHAFALKNEWSIETTDGEQIATFRHARSMFQKRAELDGVVKNGGNSRKEVAVSIRPRDSGGITTDVYIGEKRFEIALTATNNLVFLKGKDRSDWRADVCPGVDLALVAAIMLCRAEMHHVYEKKKGY